MTIQKDLRNLVRQFEKQAKKSVDRSAMRRLANFVLNLVKDRTRAGFGVKPSTREGGGRRFRLPPFSDSYIDQRLRQARRISRFGFISRPNNTFTGRMLSDLRVNAVSKGSFSLGFRSRESKRKAEFLAEMSREFMNLSAREVRLITDFYRKRILNIEI